ncbi:MAG: transglutaminase family protein [Notoacmeibacter sp.]|nr:transglutaminase family protein [Notoacmeibacter sp.]
MLYDVSVRITYDYEASADAGRHLLRLMPADMPGQQRVIASSLTVDPVPDERVRRSDFFGNACDEIAYRLPVGDTVFHMRARVERREADSLLDVSPGPDGLARELAGFLSLDATSPHHFRPRSPRVPPVTEISQWARAAAAGHATIFATASALCDAVHKAMTFDATATAVDTPVAVAFAKKRGVCQDYTHITIAALRSLGIPAGYVSGLLRTIPPKGGERLEGADAMHAWVMVWCGNEMGWVEFDPTNRMRAGEDHIVIARGRDYHDVAPVKGLLRSSGGQKTHQEVDVVEVTADKMRAPG